MTARPQDVALLPLPESHWDGDSQFTWTGKPFEYTKEDMRDYARANLSAALASAQAREDELRADAERYRFLRETGNAIVYAKHPAAWGMTNPPTSGHVRYDTPEQLDAAIDEAIALSTNAARPGETNEAAE